MRGLKTTHNLIQCNSFFQPGKGVTVDHSNKTPTQSHPALLVILWQQFGTHLADFPEMSRSSVRTLCLVSSDTPWTAGRVLMVTRKLSALPQRYRQLNWLSSLSFLCRCLCCQKTSPTAFTIFQNSINLSYFQMKVAVRRICDFFPPSYQLFPIIGGHATKCRSSAILHS